MKVILRYIGASRDHGLVFRREERAQEVVAAANGRTIFASDDEEWANDRKHGRSVAGEYLYYQGMPVGLTSRKKSAVAMSTAEVEYRAIKDILERGIYIKQQASTFNPNETKTLTENHNMPTISMIGALGATK